MRPTVQRAVAPAPAVAVTTADDDPPWNLDEPDDLMDDLPAPTRAGPVNGGRPPVRAASAVADEPDVGFEPPPAPRQAGAPIAMPAPLPEFERTALGAQWYELISKCNAASSLVALVRELAMQAELLACEADGDAPVWKLRVARETLRNPSLVEKLTNVLRPHVAPNLRLEVAAGDAQDCPARRDSAEADRRQRAAIATIQSDPTVRALLAQFQTARILPGSIKPL
jgi:DNA polymerase-3 subunit gamma/tau